MPAPKSQKILLETFNAVLPPAVFIEKRRRHGSPCALVNGNLFAAIHQNTMILRLSTEEKKDYEKEAGRPMDAYEPFEDVMLKGFVAVPEGLLADRDSLARWVRKAFDYAASLPGRRK